MKKIGFIGNYDKIDMILNIAKILTSMSKKVLVVDSTTKQKAKYIVPAISPTVSYVTLFEDIDVAVGFNTMQEIIRYLGINGELPYDIVLIDSDSIETINGFELEKADKNYFVTSFDIYSLKKGLEIVKQMQKDIQLTKVYFAEQAYKEDDDYFMYLAKEQKTIWEKTIVYFPLENGDSSVIKENQRVEKIKLKKLSIQYKDGLIFIIQQILNEKTDSNIRRVLKTLEKGV